MAIKQVFKLSVGAIGALAISMPAQAASFTGFTFDVTAVDSLGNPNNLDPTEDIFLESVSHGGSTISSFSLVTGATLAQNKHSNGPASTDLGDNASNPNGPKEQPSDLEVVSFLGNLNLNNIVDSEDDAISTLELEFDQKVNTFYFFERGLNSGLSIQTFDSSGSTLAQFRIDQSDWTSAGYSIDTQEINSAQAVGAYGVKLDSSVSKIRIVSNGPMDNGPDYKVVAAQVPEPGSMAALALLGGGALLAKRRKQAA